MPIPPFFLARPRRWIFEPRTGLAPVMLHFLDIRWRAEVTGRFGYVNTFPIFFLNERIPVVKRALKYLTQQRFCIKFSRVCGKACRKMRRESCSEALFHMQYLLDTPVLVLNRLWQAVNTCSARRAFTLLYQGHAQVVAAEPGQGFITHDFASWRDFSRSNPEENMAQTISMQIRVPRIIVLLLFERLPKKEVKFTRHNVFERDKNTCQYCNRVKPREELNLDHVFPRDRGGQTTWENIVCSCIPCNTRKGNRLPHEAGMQLARKPKRPKWRPFVNISFSTQPHESWKHFLDIAYWNVELSD